MEHKFSLTDKEADLLADVLSHSLRGIPMRFDRPSRAFLINFKNALERKKAGRRPQTALVEDVPVVRLL